MKRTVWRHIRPERSHVTTPHDYAALAKQLCSNGQIEFVAKSEIDQQFTFLDAKECWQYPKHTEFTAFKLLVQIRLK